MYKKKQKELLQLIFCVSFTVVLFNFSSVLAAIPISNADPFAAGEKGLQTLIEKGINITKWFGVAGLLVCIAGGMIGRFNVEIFKKVGFGMTGLAGLSWFVELWLVNG